MSQQQLSISELMELLRHETSITLKHGLMDQINNALSYENLDAGIKNVISSYLAPNITTGNRYLSDVAKPLISAWDQYQWIINIANSTEERSPFVMRQQMQQLNRLLRSDKDGLLLSESVRARMVHLTSEYEKNLNQFQVVPVREITTNYNHVIEMVREAFPLATQHHRPHTLHLYGLS